MRRRAALASFILLCAAGCSEGADPQPSPDAADPPAAAAPAPSQPPATPIAPTDATLVPLTAEGWGPLRIGMTLAQVTAALGPDSDPNAVGGADPAQCDQFRPLRAPQGMLVIVEEGRLSRISLTKGSPVRTDRGFAVGAAAAAVSAAYGADVRAEPHKYDNPPAQYLTVWNKGAEPGSSNARGVRYEVNGDGKVTMIHAGGPSIQYVEGCS